MERKRKKKALKMQQQEVGKSQIGRKRESQGDLQFKQPKNLIPTPTHKSSYGFGKF